MGKPREWKKERETQEKLKKKHPSIVLLCYLKVTFFTVITLQGKVLCRKAPSSPTVLHAFVFKVC